MVAAVLRAPVLLSCSDDAVRLFTLLLGRAAASGLSSAFAIGLRRGVSLELLPFLSGAVALLPLLSSAAALGFAELLPLLSNAVPLVLRRAKKSSCLSHLGQCCSV